MESEGNCLATTFSGLSCGAMRWLEDFLIIVASTFSVQAEDWTTADGKTYKNVVVIGQESDGVRVTWEGGVGKLPFYELDDDTLRKLGQDPAAQAIKRATFVKAQATTELQAKQDAAIAKRLQARRIYPYNHPHLQGNGFSDRLLPVWITRPRASLTSC